MIGTHSHGFDHIAEYPLMDILRNNHPRTVFANGTFYEVKRKTKRNRVLRSNNCRCHCCGIAGTHAILDVDRIPSRTASFNIYAERNGQLLRMTIDHIIPVSKGGPNTRANMQLLCERCNRVKDDKLLGLKELRCLVGS